MIPVRLTVRDFLSYADPEPIDFTGFDVACLSGDNGAGKSALLDALTWALFGAARGCEGGQNQDRLIRDGADEALVDLEFLLNDCRYRVVRRRGRTGKGEVRFLVSDGDDWRNIAGETLRETETRIASTLRMDYRTFTASAFFVQNRAEDFLARMRAEERKEVFARLLDLGAYERLEEAARSRARDADVRRAEHARRVTELAAATEGAGIVQEQLTAAEVRAHEASTSYESAAKDLDAKRAVVGELEKGEARLEAERASLAELEASTEQIRRAAEERRTEMHDLDALLARADEVRAAQAEGERLAAEEHDARQRQARASELQTQRAALVERIDGERKVIESRLGERRKQLEVGMQKMTELERREKDLNRVEKALAGSEDPRPAIAQTRSASDEQRVIAARLGEELRTLEAMLADIKERSALLRRGEGECPICGSALDAEHRRQVEATLRAQTSELNGRKQAARAGLATARKEAARCGEELRRLEGGLAEREKLLADREAMRARVEPASGLRDEVASLETSAAADAQLLKNDAFAADLRERAESLGIQIESVYDPAAHEALRARMAGLTEEFGALGGRLEEASARRSTVQRELEELTERVIASEKAFGQRSRALGELAGGLAVLPAAREELLDAQRVLDDRRHVASSVGAEVARLTERLEAARRAAAERDLAQQSEREAATEHRRYSRLVQAFGRGGIPDLIIDNARPDLEADANTILGRLTDYEMSVHFAMQRGTKSGKAKETFDVLVHHDGGLRDFAMFSGGEAFRIAFAVRLALSKLLVRRAGARLETLVIDEGFGTQDPEGRERLIEAINVAREEFAKVLVITHLDDLKEAFGAQIQVSKDPGRGSVVGVIPA